MERARETSAIFAFCHGVGRRSHVPMRPLRADKRVSCSHIYALREGTSHKTNECWQRASSVAEHQHCRAATLRINFVKSG